DGLNLNILRDNGKVEVLDQIDPRVRSISMAVSPKIGEEIFYIDQEKIRNRSLSCIKVAKPGSEPRILAKSKFPITGLDIDCEGKYLYYSKTQGGDERGFYLKCRKIIRS
ncbi:MAG: hypothetical protein KAT77_05835, partial [Nanoarchaeota archaeon]|nr:hypothetical protein [Nanoarchaeota archaeon]